MSKVDWKIVYTDYSGMEKKAVELICKEIGGILNRDKGRYALRVLPCEKQGAPLDKNVILLGLYDENEDIRKLIRREEIPENGYAVKVTDNPYAEGFQIALITAFTKANLFYGTCSFLDDYLPLAAPVSGGLRTPCEAFDGRMPEYFFTSYPRAKTRSIFTWGHPLNDYRGYIERAARMKINQLLIWNDFLPVNAEDVVACAHEYGIELFWGFPWGWGTSCEKVDMHALKELEQQIINTYKTVYHGAGDGIYFQSFTELQQDRIDGILIAEAVAEFVNDISAELYKIKPDLRIQFGLHATSVKDHIEYIGKVDPRIEIVWEDCGCFPYNYDPHVKSEEDYLETIEFTKKIVNLREVNPIGLVYKGMMTMDWKKFTHQAGPYVLGMAGKEQIESDIEMLKPIWKYFQSEWMVYGRYAWRFTREVCELTKGNVNLNIAVQTEGAIWFPMALCTELMWSSDEPFEDILTRVSKRRSVTFVS